MMRLVDASTGLVECKVCGDTKIINTKPGGGSYRGAWQCLNGCKPEDLKAVARDPREQPRRPTGPAT